MPAAKNPTPQLKAKKTVRHAPAVIDADDQQTPVDGALMGLTTREARFVNLYLGNGLNAGDAYVAAGFMSKPGRSAWSNASRLMTSDKVRRYLSHRVKGMFKRLEDQQDALMQALTLIAFADARELSGYHRGACHYCHGKLNRYQYTAGEWDAIMTKYAERQEKAEATGRPAPPAPDPKGGTGYEWGRDPHPDCPECAGWGDGRLIVHDTRHLSPAGVLVYSGVKVVKGRAEVKIQNRMQALEMLAKIAKLYEDTTTINVTVTADELLAKQEAKLAEGRARMAAMREERRKLRAGRTVNVSRIADAQSDASMMRM